MKPSIEIEGIRELRRDLKRIGDSELKSEMVAANRQIAADVVRKALPNVPVLTGRLRASVRGIGNMSGAVGKAGSAAVPYAAAIHWGRKRGGAIAPRPFLWRAAQTVEPAALDEYTKRVDRLFDAVRSR